MNLYRCFEAASEELGVLCAGGGYAWVFGLRKYKDCTTGIEQNSIHLPVMPSAIFDTMHESHASQDYLSV